MKLTDEGREIILSPFDYLKMPNHKAELFITTHNAKHISVRLTVTELEKLRLEIDKMLEYLGVWQI